MVAAGLVVLLAIALAALTYLGVERAGSGERVPATPEPARA